MAFGSAPRALACWATKSRELWLGGAGRPELDLLGYAPRSRRLAQLLGGLDGCSARTACASTALLRLLGCLVCYRPLANTPSYYEKRPKPTERDYFQKTLCPGDFQDPLESLKNIIWDVAIRPVELLVEAQLHRRGDPQR